MEIVIICLAGFLGGMLNAVAGGGSFFTLPALIFIGVPPVLANATGTAALLPGYIASAWRFRYDIEYPSSLGVKGVILIAILGGLIGAALLLVTDQKIFSFLIPWLILFATSAFIVGPKLLALNQSGSDKKITENSGEKRFSIAQVLGLLAVCTYGGYFNGGLGILLLATLGLMGQTNLQGMNGLKNIISALLTVIAVVLYAIGGAIVIERLLWMGLSAMLGGYVGAALAYRISQKLLRGFIIFVGGILTIIFFLR
jgi:uncharacterized membrane protein YfcA